MNTTVPPPKAPPQNFWGTASAIWFTTAIANLILAGMVFFFILHSRETAEAEAKLLTENYAQILDENIAGYIDRVDLALLNAVDEIQRQQRQGGVKPAELKAFLARQDSYIPETYGLRVSDAAGEIIYAVSHVKGANVSIKDRPQFLHLRDNPAAKLFMGKPVIGRISLKPAFPLARRYNKPDGSFGGVIFVGVPVEYFIKLFSKLDLKQQGISGLWDQETLFARYSKADPDGAQTGATTPSAQLKALLDAGVSPAFYQAHSGIDGVLRTYHFRKLSNHSLFLVVGLAEDDYLAEWRRNTLLLGILVSLLLAGSLLIARQANLSLKWREAAQARLFEERNLLEERVEERTAALSVAKEAAEAANLAKTAFLSNMSHEMRTPLHHMHGMAQLIRRETLSPKQTDRMDKLEAACRHLTDLIDTVLNLTRIEAGKFDLTEAPLSIAALMNEAVSTMQTRATAKHLELVAEIPAIDTPLLGDAEQLKAALINYLDNAIRFTEAGSVRLRAELLEEDAHTLLIRFEVKDTGIGITPEARARLFTIFEQADNSTTRRYSGLGVGLAMTKKIAIATGGDAGCESTPGEGSQFWLTVRLKKA